MHSGGHDRREASPDRKPDPEEHEEEDEPVEPVPEVDMASLTGRQRKLFELRLKMVAAC